MEGRVTPKLIVKALSGTVFPLGQNESLPLHQPIWAKNKDWVTYVQNAGVISHSDIYDTGGHLVFYPASGCCGDLTWSPDGQKLAFTSGRNFYVVDGIDQAQAVKITDYPVPPSEDARGLGAPDWSPSGSKLLFARDYKLYTMNPDGSGLATLDTGGSHSSSSPQWSPDGSKVVYTCAYGEEKDEEICIINADGSGQTRLTFSPGADTNPRFVP
jgi:Tol biopolymer transport system component